MNIFDQIRKDISGIGQTAGRFIASPQVQRFNIPAQLNATRQIATPALQQGYKNYMNFARTQRPTTMPIISAAKTAGGEYWKNIQQTAEIARNRPVTPWNVAKTITAAANTGVTLPFRFLQQEVENTAAQTPLKYAKVKTPLGILSAPGALGFAATMAIPLGEAKATGAISKTLSKTRQFLANPEVDRLLTSEAGGLRLGVVKATNGLEIHPHDLAEMSDFTDYAVRKFTPGINKFVYEGNIREMAAHYGINPNQSNTKLATQFGRVLDKSNFGQVVNQLRATIGSEKGFAKIPGQATKGMEDAVKLARNTGSLDEFGASFNVNPRAVDQIEKSVREGKFKNWADFWSQVTGKELPKPKLPAFDTTRGYRSQKARMDIYQRANLPTQATKGVEGTQAEGLLKSNGFVSDIGQLTAKDKNWLNQQVKAGNLEKVQGDWRNGLTGGEQGYTYGSAHSIWRPTKVKGVEGVTQKAIVETKGKVQSPLLKVTSSKTPSTKVLPSQKATNLVPQVDTASLPNVITPRQARGGVEPPPLDFTQFKDKPVISLTRETLERNIEDVAKGQSPQVKKFIVDPVRSNETTRIEFLNATRNEIKTNVIDKLGIKPGTKEDALIQRFGEGKISLQQLQKETPKWQQVTEASQYFRGKYDQLLDQVNQVRSQFGYDPIPKRKDYFRHFQEIDSVIRQFGLILRKEELPTEISGLTSIFSPGKPFSTVELQRKGAKYTESAIKGMDNYLDTISGQIFHIDSVQRARGLEKYIRDAALADKAKLPNFVANLHEYGNLISGKKGSFDRAFEGILGRQIYGISNTLRTRTSANMIGANISSALTNFIPFSQSLATTGKQYAARGIFDAVLSPFSEFKSISGVKSGFLTRRFPSDPISLSKMQKAQGVAGWLFEAVDRFVAKSTVSMKYYENIAKGIQPQEAIKLADEYAGKVIADRSLGNLPNIFGQRSLGFITQFQVEINNVASFLVKDIPHMSEGNALKVASTLGQFTVYSYLYNSLFEKVTGRRPTLDPIYAGLTLLGKSEEGEGQPLPKRMYAAGRDISENLPFTGGIFGGRFPISAGIPDVPGLLKGETNLKKEVTKPLFYLAPPFGGGQLKKTLEGTLAYSKGVGESQTGRVQYPIAQTPQNLVRSTLFGRYATPEARQYFNTGQTPLGEKQSEVVKAATDKQAIYQGYINQRINNKIEDINKQMGEGKISQSQGLKQIEALQKQIKGGGEINQAPTNISPPKLKTKKAKKIKLAKAKKGKKIKAPKLTQKKAKLAKLKIKKTKLAKVKQYKSKVKGIKVAKLPEKVTYRLRATA